MMTIIIIKAKGFINPFNFLTQITNFTPAFIEYFSSKDEQSSPPPIMLSKKNTYKKMKIVLMGTQRIINVSNFHALVPN